MASAAVETPAVAEETKIEVEAQPESEKAEAAAVEAPAASEAGAEGLDDKEKKLAAMRQIEFYFADANLPYDKFMWTLHTANAEHWVPIKTVASFKRMRDYQPLGLDWVADALRLSTELEVSADGAQVRRRTEPQPPKDQFERSIYAKGFGAEVDGLQKQLEQFFNKYGTTNAVRMRRIDGTKEFKGSVFVEFADYKSVEAFLNADPKPSWNGEELLIMSKEAYCEMKIKEKGLTGKAAQGKRQALAGPKSRGFNAFREMEEKSKDKGKSKEKEAEKNPEVFLEFMGTRIRVHEEDGVGHVKPEDVPLVRGATLRFTGSGEQVKFDEVKGTLKERFARAPFVQYKSGETSGLVAFDKALNEDEITYVKEHLKTLDGKEVSWDIPNEETEEALQVERAQTAAQRALQFSQRNNRGGAAEAVAAGVAGVADVADAAGVVDVAEATGRRTAARRRRQRPTASRPARSENARWSPTARPMRVSAARRCPRLRPRRKRRRRTRREPGAGIYIGLLGKT
ncbi:hypothetical protein WOLCODRAFT_138250 [Wolfiporia cocos MD-104 SS10]|uniref:HTH La-type RNA-binding domain-containing protein n=1 Tax=Wolfiporia cocos (strain MD-104) TaxID=742152 RepID=A0A2H3JLZ6_WOLCO|nr:hypothetical protein WOLCODRAFT_138250 [Wolfiporia cocos MD-104 SS10]